MGGGLTLILNCTGVPVQPCAVGVTEMTASSVTLTLAAVKLILPAPEAPSPILVLELIQLNTAPAVPFSGILTCVPPQGVWLGMVLTTGSAWTVIVKLCGRETQPFSVAVTVTTEVMAEEPLFWAVKLIFPAPVTDKPVTVLSFVQEKAAPVLPEKFTFTGSPGQTDRLTGCISVGSGSIVSVTAVLVALTQFEASSRASA